MKRRRLSVANLSSEITDVSTDSSSHHQGESEEVRTTAIYSHALLRMHVIGGQRLVRVAPPSLPPHHSSPVTLITTGAFSRNVGKLFSELKLVPDNLLFIYPEVN